MEQGDTPDSPISGEGRRSASSSTEPSHGAGGSSHPTYSRPVPHQNCTEALGREIERLRGEFRSIPSEMVIPFKTWLREKPWNVLWARWFLAYAMFPFLLPVALVLFEGQSSDITTVLTHIGWAYSAFFSVLWLMVLHICMQPGPLNYRLLTTTAAFTAIVGIPLVLAFQNLPIFHSLYAYAREDILVFRLIGFVLGVGLLEESCKALPIYLLVYRQQCNYPPLMFAFIGVVSGLAFGVVEAGGYAARYAGRLTGIGDLPGYLLNQFLRLITLPLLHACWSAVSCYFIGLAYLNRRAARPLILTGLAIPILLHGCYDTLVESMPLVGIGLALLSLLLFIAYVQTGNRISQQLMAHFAPPSYDLNFPTREE